jgi:alkylation response protein AidB-like acyl-CoA dehydrogenase
VSAPSVASSLAVPSALDADQVALAEVARSWLAARSPMEVVRESLEADSEPLPPFWHELVGMGWIGLAVPEAVGGQGGGTAELAVVLEEWGRAVAPGPFPGTALAATVLGGVAPGLARPLLDGATAAVAVGVGHLGIHRDSAGSGVRLDGEIGPIDGGGLAEWFLLPVAPESAAPDGDGAGLTARWAWVSADRLERTVHRSADPTRRPATVRLSDLAVEQSLVLEVPRGLVEHLASVLWSAEAVGVASWCVATAAAWAAERVQFDRPIGAFQAVKHRCADALCRLELARAATWDAAGLDPAHPELPLAAATAVALAPSAALDCAKDAIQVLGGIGYNWEHDAHLYLRRASLLARVAAHVAGPGPGVAADLVGRALAGQRRTLRIDLPPDAEAVRPAVREAVARIHAAPKGEWNTLLADGGWISPHWPEPWGRGAGPLEQLVIDEELAAAGIRRPHLQVAAWVLPTLIAHGSPQQQERFIAASLRHEVTWCQLFSEPGAGSDLASLATRAERVDGGWALTGQKVWTTMAREADFGICLARTSPDAPKHEGITCFLVDMRAEGIDVRPLRELTGFALFNEVFLDGVVVPDDMVVGAVHDGWRCARTTLENERVSMGSGSSFGPGVLAVLELAAERRLLGDAAVVRELGSLLATSQALAVLGLRSTVRAVRGRPGAGTGTVPGPEASVRKLIGVEHEQRVQDVALDLLGPDAVVDEGVGARWWAGFLGNRALSIAGGTSEVQRNVIGERLLGLPRD